MPLCEVYKVFGRARVSRSRSPAADSRGSSHLLARLPAGVPVGRTNVKVEFVLSLMHKDEGWRSALAFGPRITVGDLLQVPVLRDASVVAGHAGLHRVVRGVNVMEVPDVAQWVRAGDLLFTTGYVLRDDPDLTGRLLPELAARGVAALGFKPGRFLSRIPEVMVAEADRLGVPLIEIPFQLSYSDLIHPLMREIVSRQASFLEQSDRLHRHLTEVALAGRDLGAVATALGRVISNPVLIEGDGTGLRAAYPDDQVVQRLLRGQVLEPDRQPPLAQDLPLPEGSDTPFEHEWVRVDEDVVLRVSVPILAGGERFGRIMIWALEGPLRQLDYMAVERTLTLAAFEIVKQRAVAEVERRYRNVLLDQILSGAEVPLLGQGDDAPLLASTLAGREVVVAAVGGPAPSQRVYERVVRSLKPERHADRIVVGEKAGCVILIGDAALFNEQAPWLEDLCRDLKDHDVRVGVGRPVRDLAGLRHSYQQALQALDVGRFRAGAGTVVRFDELGVLRLLHLIRDRGEVDQFLAETVGPLQAYDQEHGTDLVGTLQAYFAEHGNARRAAQRLYVHYNTVLYRLQRITEITGLSLDDADARLNLQVGMKLLRLVGDERGTA